VLIVKVVDEGIRQLSAIEMDDLNSGVFRKDNIKRVAPEFQGTYKALLRVMSLQNKTEREISAKESNETKSSNSEPTTPDQPTHPVDPDFTSLSIESKDEENTRQLLLELLSNTISVLEEGFRSISWQRSNHPVEIAETYKFHKWGEFIANKLFREKDNSTFRLGVETIRAINDGGLGIYYNLGRGPTQFQPYGVRPVLSLEVIHSYSVIAKTNQG
jgi:hypothetical protein